MTHQAIETDPRWTAVLRREPAETFVYGVRTTGIYCRPSCPSRRAKPENVAFYAGPAEAEQAGLRACRRCRPDGVSPAGQAAAQVAAACQAIERAARVPSLAKLARTAGLSPFHFHRLFKQATGLTPHAYGQAVRARRVRGSLGEAGRGRGGQTRIVEASVTESLYDAGYGSSSRFYAASEAVLGMTPSQFRAGAPEVAIRSALAPCTLGLVLVAATDKGVCAILLGDDGDTLRQDLDRRFPGAEVLADDAGFEALVARVVALVDRPGRGDLPLDIRGTAFQQRVWQALRQIPAGRTASYAEIARTIGQPGSVRAVAGACAANPLAVAVPCHRVVRTDGGLSGYRWGVERKRALLDREAAVESAGNRGEA